MWIRATEPCTATALWPTRPIWVYSSGLVTYGRAVVLVTTTGMDTEIGEDSSPDERYQGEKTPLQVSLDQFGSRLATGNHGHMRPGIPAEPVPKNACPGFP